MNNDKNLDKKKKMNKTEIFSLIFFGSIALSMIVGVVALFFVM